YKYMAVIMAVEINPMVNTRLKVSIHEIDFFRSRLSIEGDLIISFSILFRNFVVSHKGMAYRRYGE
ncbi:MAG: hypothetical protein WBV95_06835, partial [Desulfobacterales bacterium]